MVSSFNFEEALPSKTIDGGISMTMCSHGNVTLPVVLATVEGLSSLSSERGRANK